MKTSVKKKSHTPHRHTSEIKRSLPALQAKKILKNHPLILNNIKSHPFISFGTAAIALGAVSGLVTWYKTKKDAPEKMFFILRRR